MSEIRGGIDREIAGEPIVVGELTVLPTIQACGWSLGFGPAAGGAGAWSLRLTPGPVSVRGPDGQEFSLPLDSTTAGALRTFSGIGAGVAALCTLAILAARRR